MGSSSMFKVLGFSARVFGVGDFLRGFRINVFGVLGSGAPGESLGFALGVLDSAVPGGELGFFPEVGGTMLGGGGPHRKEHGISWSILGSPIFGKLPAMGSRLKIESFDSTSSLLRLQQYVAYEL